MNDFDYDNLQKKRLARNAQYKKNGTKSRKCTLPHENLTKKELNAMNGEIKSYNLNRPMNWDTFKKMPEDLKSEYLRKLRARFSVNSTALSDMLGVAPGTCRGALRAAGITLSRGDKMGYSEHQAWAAFISEPETPEKSKDYNLFDDADSSAEIAKASAPVEEPEKTVDDFRIPGLLETLSRNRKTTPALKSAELTLHGSAEQIANEILRFLAQFEADMNCAVQLKFDA